MAAAADAAEAPAPGPQAPKLGKKFGHLQSKFGRHFFTTRHEEKAGPWPGLDFDPATMNYLAYVQHLAPKTETTHWHICVQWKSERSITAHQAATHCWLSETETIRDIERVIAYIKGKPKHIILTDPVFYGTPSYQGRRTDQEHYVHEILHGTKPHELVIRNPSALRYYPMLTSFAGDLPWPQMDPLANLPLCPYQERVMELLAEPRVHRRVIWVWSDEFGTGKTFLAEHIRATYPTLTASPDDPAATALSLEREHKVVIFDLPRDYVFALHTPFTLQLEKYSDGGTIRSPKYRSCSKTFYGHVVVMCNHAPLERFRDRIVPIKAIKSF